MRRWVGEMMHRFRSFAITTRGHPHRDYKRRRTRKKRGVGLLLYNMRFLMICKSWGGREIRGFTVLRNMIQAFKLFSQEIEVQKLFRNFITEVKEVINKVLN